MIEPRRTKAGNLYKADIRKAVKNAKKVRESKEDPVNNPPHYTQHPSGVECIRSPST